VAAVRYIARRSLVPGHALGSTQVLGLSLAELDRQTRPKVNASEAMSGDTYGLLIRSKVLWVCKTGPARELYADQIREFLDSCEGKERFEWAPYDSAVTPAPAWRNAVLESTGYKEDRAAMLPGGGRFDPFTFGFTIREVP
jgi:hypothetical protein